MYKKEKYAGLIAGFSLIIMALAAGFSYGFVQNQLIGETAAQTAQNLADNRTLFLAGLAGWFVVLITDIIVSGALYVFFRKVNRIASILAAVFRILYTIVFAIAIYRLALIVPLIENAELAGIIHSLINSFENIWSVGLIIFGFHLVVLGFLSIKSNHVPKILGYLLYFGGASYTFIHAAWQTIIFEPVIITKVENILALPMALSELLLAFWLIYKGFKQPTGQ